MLEIGRRFGTVCLAAVLVFMIAATAHAQQDDVITTDTALVQLNVGVVDKQGRSITNLSANDFAVFEDGVRRPIVSFEPTEAPFSLVLLLDMSGSTVNFRQQIRAAALRFLDALSPDDRVSVIQFNSKGVKSLLGFTTDRQRTAYVISELANGAGQTMLYDGLKFSLKELAKEGKRRKAVVVLTDGLDTGVRNSDRSLVAKAAADSQPGSAMTPEITAKINAAITPGANSELVSVLTDADRQGVTIFPLALPSGDPKHLPLPDSLIVAMYTAARTRLQILADRTGGRLHEIRRLDDLSRLYALVAADLRTLYSIAYQPPTPNPRDGKWREIRVEVARGELVASTKPGYYAR